MNYIQKQAELSRTLYEINTKTTQDIMKTQQEDMAKYVELSTEFGQKLPTVTDVSSFLELQREYGETLWNHIRESGETQASIMRSALEQTGEAVRDVFTDTAGETVGAAIDSTVASAKSTGRKVKAAAKKAA